MERIEQAETHALVEARACHHIAQSQHVAGRLKCFQNARSMYQALDQIPVVIGSLYVDFVGHCFVPRNANVAALPFPRIEEYGDCTLFIAEYNNREVLGMFRTAKSRPPRRSRFQRPCRAATIGLCTPISKYDSESPPGRNLSLAGRPRIRQFLCTLPRRKALVLGDLLAGRRLLQLDHRALALGLLLTNDLLGRLREAPGSTLVLVLLLGGAVGFRRTDLRAHHALSRACRSAWRWRWAIARLSAR